MYAMILESSDIVQNVKDFPYSTIPLFMSVEMQTIPYIKNEYVQKIKGEIFDLCLIHSVLMIPLFSLRMRLINGEG